MDSFWGVVEMDRKIVQSWPQWMQNYVITAEAASTGRFIRGHHSGDHRANSSMDDRE